MDGYVLYFFKSTQNSDTLPAPGAENVGFWEENVVYFERFFKENHTHLFEKHMVWFFFRFHVYVMLVGVHPSAVFLDKTLVQTFFAAAIVPNCNRKRLVFDPFVIFYGINCTVHPV